MYHVVSRKHKICYRSSFALIYALRFQSDAICELPNIDDWEVVDEEIYDTLKQEWKNNCNTITQ